jgi:hypothetical protein
VARGNTGPARVAERRITKRALGPALEKSNRGMVALFRLGEKNGGRIPMTKRYTWRNLPLDLGHVLAYFSAHEGHHRGQIGMLARQLGKRLPREVMDGLWQFSTRVRERR